MDDMLTKALPFVVLGMFIGYLIACWFCWYGYIDITFVNGTMHTILPGAEGFRWP